jgi:hypothetical protein
MEGMTEGMMVVVKEGAMMVVVQKKRKQSLFDNHIVVVLVVYLVDTVGAVVVEVVVDDTLAEGMENFCLRKGVCLDFDFPRSQDRFCVKTRLKVVLIGCSYFCDGESYYV